MLRSILFPLDAGKASDFAGETAINLCKTLGTDSAPVRLTALGIVDRPGIEKPEPTPMGGGAFKDKRDEALLTDAREKIDRALEAFSKRCEQSNTQPEIRREEGDPRELIEEWALVHDLIVVGKQTNFHFETDQESGATVASILRDHPRPALVTPTDPPQGEATLIAYDASRACAHSIHYWILLGMSAVTNGVHLVSVDRDHERAIGMCEEARTFLSRHDIEADVHPVESNEVVESILDVASRVGAGTLVMGAYGTKGIKALFGSTTRELYDASPYSLFVV